MIRVHEADAMQRNQKIDLQPRLSESAPPIIGAMAGPIRGTAPYTPKKPALSAGGAMSPIIPAPSKVL
jgi:hypothetical protein